MPPTKKPAKTKTAKRTTVKSTKKASKKAMSPTHKKALAAGRNESAAVNRYLAALHTPNPRGRKVSPAALRARVKNAEGRAATAIGLDRVLAHQELRDLRARLAAAGGNTAADIKKVEQEFVRVAKRFSERRGISHGAWRDAGVPASVLKRTGIARTRG